MAAQAERNAAGGHGRPALIRRIDMKFSRSLCVLLLAFATTGTAGATSCAGNSSFRQLVQEARENTAVRVARVRVVSRVTYFTIVPDLMPVPDDLIFEVLEFLDDRSNGGAGTKFSESGVIGYLLGQPLAGRTQSMPVNSEWVLRVREHGGTINVGACGAILEVRDNAVQGLVKNPAGTPPGWRSQAIPNAGNDASQSMPSSDFRHALKAQTDRNP